MKLQRVLVLDDESAARSVTAEILRELKYSALAVSTVRQAEKALKDEEFDLVLSDIRLEGDSGISFLQKVRESYPNLPLMIMTGFGTLDTAVEAIRLGVFEYLLKPIDPSRLEWALSRLEESLTLKAENNYLREQEGRNASANFYMGKSPAMQKMQGLIDKICLTDATVLIRGESGTGKEVVARMLHRKGRRHDKPFIRVNCAAIPENLLESEFFGHEKGAFTGATQRRQGRFELADEGTLLLDEISEIPPDLQVKLLRVLQEREFERVGGNKTIKVDVNIIATTNRLLEQEVKQGQFREDLYYRLNVVPIQMPPLRERGSDLEELANFFVNQFSRKHGKEMKRLSNDLALHLQAYPWPGNVRELQNAVERAVIMADGTELKIDDFPLANLGASSQEEAENVSEEGSAETVKPLVEVEKQCIIRALERCGGNRTRSAKLLGISLRNLRNKINKYREEGIEIE
ncbi:MAG: sigma-54 dependent transcriptional regulator [Verrucomicrobiota bacterium]